MVKTTTNAFRLLICASAILAFIGCRGKGSGQDAIAVQSAQVTQVFADPDGEFPETLAQTNLFLDGDPRFPQPNMVPYTVNIPLWTDDAKKERYVFVPYGAKIEWAEADKRYKFPVGTVFIKHFHRPDDAKSPLETRLMLQREQDSWDFVSYAWNDDGTTERLDDSKLIGELGEPDTFRVPSPDECTQCHDASVGTVNGFDPGQLDLVRADGADQLEALKILFSEQAAAARPDVALPDPTDESYSVEVRLRSYLDKNCSFCHNPNGYADFVDMRAQTPLEETNLLEDGIAVFGDPEGSKLWERFTAELKDGRMPPTSLREDPLGLELIKAWLSGDGPEGP